jgi:LysM domain
MDQTAAEATFARCFWVLLMVTSGTAVLMGLLLPDGLTLGASIRTGAVAREPFDEVLVHACEVAVCGCAAWLWLATVVMTADAAHGREHHTLGVPRAWRRLVLAACGVALVGSLGAPAHARDGGRTSPLEGLRLPDRAATTTHVSQVFARAAAHQSSMQGGGTSDARPRVVVVRPGDTLWDLARTELPPGADDATVAARVRQIHRANRAVIGANPDLIRPHQRLRMPPTTREETR